MIEMDKLTERLKGPDMVASFQKYFGIRAIFCDDQGMINNVISKESGVNVHHHHHHTKSSSSNKKVVYSQSNGHVTEDKEVYKRKRVHKEDDNRSIMDENNCYYTAECSQNGHTVKYEITNKFWYWLFAFGASLGYEIFYATFFPFWFWNIDGAVGRQMILLWALVMYVGQSLKDVIRWPRPSSPPVVVMEPEYAIEYGMPSTHAMVGSVLPFSMVIFTMHRYDYPAWIGFVFATLWCALVCGSRLYLGMHSVLDILAGLVLSAIMMLLLLPIIEALDTFLLINKYSPFLSIPLVIAMASFYPKSDHWSPARGDTCVIIGAGSGILFGSWLNYQLGIIRGPSLSRPFPILWPGFNLIGLALLRACIGILCIVGVRALGKFTTFSLVCYIHKLNPKDPETKIKPYVEIPVKLLTYFFMGISITYLAPKVFRLLYIERPTMFTEV